MRIDRRLVLIGVMIIVLSMTMATQYAQTKIGYSYAIVHPSDADIRFIGSDNSSDDNIRVLRISNNDTAVQTMTVELGDFSVGQLKNYSAAFGIVNEEEFRVNISYINVSGTNSSYLTIWLHGDRDIDYAGDGAASVKVVNDGSALYSSSDVVWTLGYGDGNTDTMDNDPSAGGTLTTWWDNHTSANVKCSVSDVDAANETSDFVWVGISIDLRNQNPKVQAATGTIYIHFKSSTLDDE